MRVLHLIDPGSPGGGGCTLALLGEAVHRLNTVDHRVLVIGNRRRADLARRCGVRPDGQLSAPLGMPVLARQAAKRLRHAFEQSTHEFDIIHAWTVRSALLAMLAFPKTRCLATMAIGPLSSPELELFLTLLRRRPMPIITTSAGVFREYESLGVDPDLLSILPPAVNPQSQLMRSRDELRQRWELDDDTFVVGLLSEPASWADAQQAVDIAARPTAAGRQIRIIVHRRARRRLDGMRWARELGWKHFVITDDEAAEPWRIVNGLDAALLVGRDMSVPQSDDNRARFATLLGGGGRLRPMPGIMPLLWAFAAELPVIAEESEAVRDVIEDGVNGFLLRPGDFTTAAARLTRMADDRTIGHRLGGAGLETIHERFHISAYAVRLKDTYEHVMAGLPPHVLGVDHRPFVARFEPSTAGWTAR